MPVSILFFLDQVKSICDCQLVSVVPYPLLIITTIVHNGIQIRLEIPQKEIEKISSFHTVHRTSSVAPHPLPVVRSLSEGPPKFQREGGEITPIKGYRVRDCDNDMDMSALQPDSG